MKRNNVRVRWLWWKLNAIPSWLSFPRFDPSRQNSKEKYSSKIIFANRLCPSIVVILSYSIPGTQVSSGNGVLKDDPDPKDRVRPGESKRYPGMSVTRSYRSLVPDVTLRDVTDRSRSPVESWDCRVQWFGVSYSLPTCLRPFLFPSRVQILNLKDSDSDLFLTKVDYINLWSTDKNPFFVFTENL